jgi:hypothetical protein
MRVLVTVTPELVERLRAECERHLAANWTDELEVDAEDVLALLDALAAEKERADAAVASAAEAEERAARLGRLLIQAQSRG